MFSRRVFLKGSALALYGASSAPLWLQRAALGAEQPSRSRRTLVVVFLRGAADGLNIVVPFGDPAYRTLRPNLAVPAPAAGADPATSALNLDGFFGLHPALTPLSGLFRDEHLAIVHAAGSPDPTRSHFDAQDYMDSGTPGRKGTPDGWLNRSLKPQDSPSPVRAIAMGSTLPRSLQGDNPALAIANIASFRINDSASDPYLRSMYAGAKDPVLQKAGRETFEALQLMDSLRAMPPSAAAPLYPRGPVGDALRQVAQIIRSGAGLEAAAIDVGGWDHHVNEIGRTPAEGQLANLLAQLGGALSAFWQDLGADRDRVVLVTMSEFGRTAKENGDRGTDHGHANCMFVLGGPVRGGKVYGQWPGLQPGQLYEQRDLAVTTDFRAVLAELVRRHLGNTDLGRIFPGFEAAAPELGLLRA